MADSKTFEGLSDWADFKSLKSYEGLMKAWILVKDKNLKIGDVANAFYYGFELVVNEWVLFHQIEVWKSLHEIPSSKNGWMVVYFEDVYFLKPYID